MPNINISISHKIKKEEVLRRLKAYISNNVAALPNSISNISFKWQGFSSDFSFHTSNVFISGTVSINDNMVSIKSKIPIIFFPLKNQIEKIVRRHAEDILK